MKKVGCILLVVVIVLLCCCGSSSSIFLSDRYTPDRGDQIPYDLTPDLATISGTVGYPSEFIPRLKVCAQQIDTNDEYCTFLIEENQSYDTGFGYTLEIPLGGYYVYSMEIDEQNEPVDQYQAYYTQFVECGMEYSCPSHEPIMILLSESDQSIDNIDPIDWYSL